MTSLWRLSRRSDPHALPLADRHYNRQTPGASQFVPPGRCVVLLTPCERAFWVTSFPFAEYVRHRWAGAWMCSAFRNEGAGLSSDLIRSAVSATRWRFGPPPSLGMVTFIDPTKVRQKRNHGYCYLRAGFRRAACPEHWLASDLAREEPGCAACQSRTEGGLLALQLRPEEMPSAIAPSGAQLRLLEAA